MPGDGPVLPARPDPSRRDDAESPRHGGHQATQSEENTRGSASSSAPPRATSPNSTWPASWAPSMSSSSPSMTANWLPGSKLLHPRGNHRSPGGVPMSQHPFRGRGLPAAAGHDRRVLPLLGHAGSIPISGPPYLHHGGNTSCLDVEYGGEHVIFDAGSGIRDLGLDCRRAPAQCTSSSRTRTGTTSRASPFSPPPTCRA